MNIKEFETILKNGENTTVEFKSWVKAKNFKELVNLAVDELIAFANAKGGTVFMGVEDSGEVTGCFNYDIQKFIEAIYDKTRPPLFVEEEEIEYQGKKVLALSVACDGHRYATNDGRCLKRLGKNSKPYYPEEMSNRFDSVQAIGDFSSKIVVKSTLDDIDLLEVYKLKEKLRVRDSESTLCQMNDLPFLRDLGLLVDDNGVERLSVAGMLFVGKEASLKKFLPQHEVIYLQYGADNLDEYNSRIDMKQPIITILDRLKEKIQNDNKIVNLQVGLFRMEIKDYSENVFQEALLNALAHRDYESMASVYVKHYPDKIVIENPGGFIDGVTPENIITHPSSPRNKLIAETLQRLKYVQRTGQGVDIIYRETISMGKPYPEYTVYSDAIRLSIRSFSENLKFVEFIVKEQDEKNKSLQLSELMVLRYLIDNKRIKLATIKKLTQLDTNESKKLIHNLIKASLMEVVGKEYMLTSRVYDAMKLDIEYAQDIIVNYIRAKDKILEYININGSINIEKVRVLCGYTKDQARRTLEKLKFDNLIQLSKKGRYAEYTLVK